MLDDYERELGDVCAVDDGLSAFVGVRSRLFGIAYRVLGSSAEAEDVVQEAWLRWQATDRSVVLEAPAFLVTTTTRLAINAARSARSRRETYLGPWLPEPVDTSADPELATARSEALGLAVFLLLEKLPPTERAAYVLSHAFDYSYAQIAEMLQVSEANARQLASRARKHLGAERRQQVRSSAQRRLLGSFLVAARSGDLAPLEDLFVADVADDPGPREPCVRSRSDRRQPSLRRTSGSEGRCAPVRDDSRGRERRLVELAS